MPNATIETSEVQPLPDDRLKSLEHQLLDLSKTRLITQNTKITCEGKLKALFLKADTVQARLRDSVRPDNARPDVTRPPVSHRPQYRSGLCGPILDSHYRAALGALKLMKPSFNRAKATLPESVVKQRMLGRELVLGWLYKATLEDVLRAGTRDQFFLAMRLVPLIQDFQSALQQHLPEYWQFHLAQAKKLVRPPDEKLETLHRVADPHQKRMLEVWDQTQYYHFMGVEAFSTLTLNHNILFGAHADRRNMPGTLGCLTALGDYAGGALCFPRLGVAFDLRPRDLLVADTNEEFHGSSSLIVGDRYSVVAYLHGGLDKGWRPAYDKRGALKGIAKITDRNKHALRRIDMRDGSQVAAAGNSEVTPPFTYTPNFLTRDETDELTTYFETLPSMPAKTAFAGNFLRAEDEVG
jgi:hypothetical protein